MINTFNTGHNIMHSAPTGSGKTTLVQAFATTMINECLQGILSVLIITPQIKNGFLNNHKTGWSTISRSTIC
jgi:superfamily II DNA or RNA helicase